MSPDPVLSSSGNQKFCSPYKKGKELLGREISVKEVMQEVKKDCIFYKESKGGVTFSGGEPLSQPEFLYQLLLECKKENLHTTLDTSGYGLLPVIKKILPLTDLFLFDLKLIKEQDHIKYTGVSFQPIKENLIFLTEKNTNIYIRIPIIPTFTDNKQNIEQIIAFLTLLPRIAKVNLLPYNQLGNKKYDNLGKKNRLKNIRPPSEEKMKEIQNKFEKNGFITEMGG